MNEYIEKLSKMIKCNTVSSVDDTSEKFIPFHRILEEEFPKIHNELEKVNIDGNLIFKWKGKYNDLKPLALMNHMDTAPIDGEWKYDPLSGCIEEESIWGRGAIDTKGPLCAILSACEILIEEGFKPDRDVYLMSTRNEEVRGDGGVKLANYIRENKILFETLLDEGGAIMDPPMKGVSKKYAMIGVSEKGDLLINLIGTDENLLKLKGSLEKASIFKPHVSEEVLEMLKRFGTSMSFPMNLIFKFDDYLKPVLGGKISKMSNEAASIVKTTLKFGDIKEGECSLVAKVSKEDGIKKVLKELEKQFKQFNVDYKIKNESHPTRIANWNSRGFLKIEETVKCIFENTGTSPYRLMAGTDARHFDLLSENCFRFAPLLMKIEDMKMVHGIDEKITVDNYNKCLEFYKKFIRDYDRA